MNVSVNTSTSPFSFPILKPHEIVKCLNDLNIPCAETDLSQPHSGNIKIIYELFVELLMDVPKEALTQVDFNSLNKFSYPEIYEEAIPEVTFFRVLTRLMDAVGVKDFTVKDIVTPDPKRTRRICSALINFVRFREGRMQYYTKLQCKLNEFGSQKEKLEIETQDLQTKLATLRAKHAQDEPLIQQLQKETKDQQNEIMTLNQRQVEKQTEVKKLKATQADLKDRLGNVKFMIMNNRQECTTLRSRVVQSPDKFKKLLEDLRLMLENEKIVSVEAEKRALDLQARLESLQRIEKEVQKTMKSLEELEGDMKKRKDARKKVKEAKAKLSDAENRIRELNSNAQLAQRGLQGIKDKTERLTQQQGLKLDASEQALEEAKREKLATEKQRSVTMASVDKNAVAVQEMRQKIDRLKKQHDEEVKQAVQQYPITQHHIRLRVRYDYLEQQVKQYYHSLFQSMKPM